MSELHPLIDQLHVQVQQVKARRGNPQERAYDLGKIAGLEEAMSAVIVYLETGGQL